MPSEVMMETQRLLDRATMSWQPLEPVLAEMMELVAPGRALRKYEAEKKRSDGERTGEGPVRPPLTESEKIRSGARRLCRDSLGSQRKAGRVETRDIDGVECFRFVERRKTPQVCSNCGHTEAPNFHKPSEARISLAESRKIMTEIGIEVKSNVIQFPKRKAI